MNGAMTPEPDSALGAPSDFLAPDRLQAAIAQTQLGDFA